MWSNISSHITHSESKPFKHKGSHFCPRTMLYSVALRNWIRLRRKNRPHIIFCCLFRFDSVKFLPVKVKFTRFTGSVCILLWFFDGEVLQINVECGAQSCLVYYTLSRETAANLWERRIHYQLMGILVLPKRNSSEDPPIAFHFFCFLRPAIVAFLQQLPKKKWRKLFVLYLGMWSSLPKIIGTVIQRRVHIHWHLQ